MSAAEDELAFSLRAVKIPFEQQVRLWCWHRRWRCDFLVDERLIVEVEGGLFSSGGHNRGAYIEDTMEKLATALGAGYSALRVSPRHIKDGRALKWIEAALKALPSAAR